MTTSYYFHRSDWSINTNPESGIKVPTPLVFLLVPLFGALFLMFLPFIGFALVGLAIAKKTMSPFIHVAVTPIPAPGEAHLTGAPPSESASLDTSLDGLADEIKKRRNS